MRGTQVAALNRDHHEFLYRFACLFLGNPADAEEVLQETYVKLLKEDALPLESMTRPWLYRVMLNACIDYRKSWWHRHSRNSVEVNTIGAVDRRPTPEERLLDAERMEGLQRLLKELPPRLRTPVILRDVEGLSYDEIAEALSCSIGTVSSRLNRGRKILAAALGRKSR